MCGEGTHWSNWDALKRTLPCSLNARASDGDIKKRRSRERGLITAGNPGNVGLNASFTFKPYSASLPLSSFSKSSLSLCAKMRSDFLLSRFPTGLRSVQPAPGQSQHRQQWTVRFTHSLPVRLYTSPASQRKAARVFLDGRDGRPNAAP